MGLPLRARLRQFRIRALVLCALAPTYRRPLRKGMFLLHDVKAVLASDLFGFDQQNQLRLVCCEFKTMCRHPFRNAQASNQGKLSSARFAYDRP